MFLLAPSLDSLLEQNGNESGVESTDALILQDLAEAANETVGESGCRDETDTGSLKRGQSDRGEDLGGTRRGKVDEGAVSLSSLVAKLVDGELLEDLVSSELEGALKEITSCCRSETSSKGTNTLLSNDLAEGANHTATVLGGLELDSCLDAR